MPNSYKNILVFVRHYLPGYKAGGPIRSISNLIDWCGDDAHFKVITSDRDMGDDQAFPDVKVNQWNQVGNADVFYISPDKMNGMFLFNLFKSTNYGLIYLNSFFDYKFSILPMFLLRFALKEDPAKILMAPRGELSEGALNIKSAKKRFFIRACKKINYYHQINWQATDTQEQNNIQRVMSIQDDHIFEMPNLPQKDIPSPTEKISSKANYLRIAYLSRITPKKNLLFALKILKRVSEKNIQFDIYGSVDDESYWQKCKKVIQHTSEKLQINYNGEIPHEEVLRTLSKFDLFFLPTKGENYGHAIYEALSVGTSVLISDQTPWKNLREQKLGWDLSLEDESAFIAALEEMIALSDDEKVKRKKHIRNKIRQMDTKKNVQKNKQIFDLLIDKVSISKAV